MPHDLESTLLGALAETPNDETTWLALADWFEESGQDPRAELVRLTRQLWRLSVARRNKPRAMLEDRLAELLRAGVLPAVAQRTNSLGMRFALVPPGRCRMGAPANESGRSEEEGPAHQVEMTRPLWLGVVQVTQAQFLQVTGTNPSHFCARGPGKGTVAGLDTTEFPVERVSWVEAVSFCARLAELPEERRLGRTYRLPTEAEWEYACRGGPCSTGPSHLGAAIAATHANFDGEHPYPAGARGANLMRPCPVGSYPANVFGLHDMAGNVWEWCQDWFDESYYRHSPEADPPGPTRGSRRVLRGGAFWNWGTCMRAARRVRNTPESREPAYGFRVVMETR